MIFHRFSHTCFRNNHETIRLKHITPANTATGHLLTTKTRIPAPHKLNPPTHDPPPTSTPPTQVHISISPLCKALNPQTTHTSHLRIMLQ